MMASQQASNTSSSTSTKSGPVQRSRNTTATGKKTSNAEPTVSTQAPVLTDAVQKCVDTAAEAIAKHRQAKIVFMQGVLRRILRDVYQDAPPSSAGTHTGTPHFSPPIPARPILYLVTQPNYHNGQFYPPGNIPQLPVYPATSVQPTSVQSTCTVSTEMDTTPGISTTSSCLTKSNHLLVADMKGELQTLNNQLSNFPIAEIRKEQAEAAEHLNGRLEMLEKQFSELKDIIIRRTNQSFNAEPELLEKWNPTMLVIRRSPWNNMRFILNRIASDNIADLFPSDWAPKPLFSDTQEKHFKVFCEVMTAMFYQCGILQDCNVLAIQGYEKFLKALHHHMVMGNITMGQLGHFLILMVYMSFCRMSHYTDYLSDQDAVNLEIAVWMSLVIISFRTTFHIEGSHRTINPYFKVLPTVVRRRLHVIILRYLEQECICKNHVQCDLTPTTLSSEITLPSYQHFLQYLQEKGMSRFNIINESEALAKYGKTITVIVLARVNGYYSPFLSQTIMEEEARYLYGTNFSYAEKDFFTNKFMQVSPNVTTEAVNNSIAFLERQKEANYPCTIHTQKRGYDWIVFNRMPDRLLQFNADTDTENEEETSGVGADTTTDPQGEKKRGSSKQKPRWQQCIWCIQCSMFFC